MTKSYCSSAVPTSPPSAARRTFDWSTNRSCASTDDPGLLTVSPGDRRTAVGLLVVRVGAATDSTGVPAIASVDASPTGPRGPAGRKLLPDLRSATGAAHPVRHA